VTIEIDLIRHAEKASFDGLITEKGRQEAAELGKGKNMKVYHSDAPRAKETSVEIAKDSPYVPRARKDLAFAHKMSAEFLQKYAEITKEHGGDESTALQMYLDTDNERPDEGTWSSQETSKRLAETLEHFVDVSGRLYNDSRARIVLLSHSGQIEHVLVDLFEEDRPGFIEKIGGGLHFLEGAKILISRDPLGKIIINLEFRGRRKEVDLEQLRAL
jgi:broad specificity phosphatase PhoE